VKRKTYNTLIVVSQLLVMVGLLLGCLWNCLSYVLDIPHLDLWALTLGIPGAVLWLLTIALPAMSQQIGEVDSYRLVYESPGVWDEGGARKALVNLAKCAGWIAFTWGREGHQGHGCWISLPAGWGSLLKTMVPDVFPKGEVSLSAPPPPGAGVSLLALPPDIPMNTLLGYSGIEGVYYRWKDEKNAVVSVWGDEASVQQVIETHGGYLRGERGALETPKFMGDNPWPELPPFPPSESNPALMAVVKVSRLAPEFRVNGNSVVVGKDDTQSTVGFPLPTLDRMGLCWIVGQRAAQQAADIGGQTIKAGIPTLVLDGNGTCVANLSRRFLLEIAQHRILTCDTDKPAQATLRLNPFFLPPMMDAWKQIIPLWVEWIAEMGITRGGLGKVSYAHTMASVVVSALGAASCHCLLDPHLLLDTLHSPGFLKQMPLNTLPMSPAELLPDEVWQWWLNEGRNAQSFDAQLRLQPIVGKIEDLLRLPEYSQLWDPPYLDLSRLRAVNTTSQDAVKGLLWRVPARNRWLYPYAASQMLAIAALMAYWDQEVPIVLIVYAYPGVEGWIKRVRQVAGNRVRVILAADGMSGIASGVGKPQTVLVSRLERQEDIALFDGALGGITGSQLSRLPARIVIMATSQHTTTANI
jgi:hypothetical protein